MTGLNEIYDNLKTIATDHKQINSFGFGDVWEIATSGVVDYPLFWVVPQGGKVQKGKAGFGFKFLVMDVVQRGEGNETEVLSDTHKILLDILAELKIGAAKNDYKFDIDVNVNLEDFTERFQDQVSGWAADVMIWVDWDWDRCAIPK